MEDQKYMELALELAKKGLGWTSPNPLVGAVLVKDGRIIGHGYHARCGGLHAERNALASCKGSPAGGTLYVTLEPCCHQGRQPPCTDAILDAGLTRVVVGSGDPNPLVAGKGIQLLRSHGISVTEHVLEKECRQLNEVFFHYIQTKRPYVVMKYAMTMDGKIAAYTGASKWITGEAARAHVQKLRHRYRGILAGIGTVLADDPLLTCRMEGGRDPVRIICDTHLRIPLSSQILQTAGTVPTILATCLEEDTLRKELEEGRLAVEERKCAKDRLAKLTACRNAGCQILSLPEKSGHPDLAELMERLGAMDIDSILLEGGMTLNWSALESGIVDKVLAYIAPKLLGGLNAKPPVGGTGFPHPDHAIRLRSSKITTLGEDILIESEVYKDVHRDH